MEAKTAAHAELSVRSSRRPPKKARASAVAHDIIVIGASMGGVPALMALLKALPADLNAAIFIVQHTGPGAARLPEVLTRKSKLKARYAVHGESIERGRVYVAPPDNHMMIEPGYIHVVRGPRENGHRPAVDPLFRSAARSYAARVVGVLLTGALDCGTNGLMMIKAQGGIAIVQDPEEAFQPDMPRNALKHVQVDHVAKLGKIPALLKRLSRNGKPENFESTSSQLTEAEVETALPADLACPSCGGVMTESTVNGFARFRCHTGHAFSLESLAAEQARALEGTLWAAMRALEESEGLARRMAASAESEMARRFEEKAEAMKQHARRIQRILLHGRGLNVPDASKLTARPTSRRLRTHGTPE